MLGQDDVVGVTVFANPKLEAASLWVRECEENHRRIWNETKDEQQLRLRGFSAKQAHEILSERSAKSIDEAISGFAILIVTLLVVFVGGFINYIAGGLDTATPHHVVHGHPIHTDSHAEEEDSPQEAARPIPAPRPRPVL
jgi:hypothetical protein